MNNGLKMFILIFWSFGNMIIFSGMLYIKWMVSGNSFDTYLLAGMMIIWVIGQIIYAKPNFALDKQSEGAKK